MEQTAEDELWDWGRDQGDVQQEQVLQEEVHGGLELWVQANKSDSGKVAHQGHQVAPRKEALSPR